jgi:hypothetical protein
LSQDIRQRAAKARTLLADDTFKEAVQDLKQLQVNVFLNPASTVEDREEAHHIAGALSKIEQYLQSAVMDEKMLDRRK